MEHLIGSGAAGKDHSKVLDQHVSSMMDKAKQVRAHPVNTGAAAHREAAVWTRARQAQQSPMQCSAPT